MTTAAAAITFILIRHATTDATNRGVIAGRSPKGNLNDAGRWQAVQLAERLAAAAAAVPIKAIYSSPLERARETAEFIAKRLNLDAQLVESLIEVDFGEWTNRTLVELDSDLRWQQFNSMRSTTRAPGGELMLEVQTRAVAELERLRAHHPSEAVVIVSHGDVIRAVLAHYLGIHLDLFQRFVISPASISIVKVADHPAQVLQINNTGALPDLNL